MNNGNGVVGRTLDGLDEELMALADALRAAPAARTSEDFTSSVMAAVHAERSRMRSRPPIWRSPWLGVPLAACFALLLALGSVFNRPSPTWTSARLAACQQADGSFSSSSAAPYVQAFAVAALAADPSASMDTLKAAVAAIVRDQTAEGGWANAALSVRNVAALREAAAVGVAGAQRAYRRGLRYLRLNGIREMSPADLVRAAQAMRARLEGSSDCGLACSVALCAAR